MSSTAPLRPLNIPSLRDHIEHEVLSAILSGRFALGERLVESALAEQLAVSRAPVREALAALERQGIVVSIPRRGYFVADFTDKDVEEIYSLRLLLEIEALRRAMDRFTDEQKEELRRIVTQLGSAIGEGGNSDKTIALDFSFHKLIVRAADHSRLYAAWNSMRLQTWLLIGLTSKTHYEFPDQSKQVHERILNAILASDLDSAETALREHIVDARQRAMTVLRLLHSGDGKVRIEPSPRSEP